MGPVHNQGKQSGLLSKRQKRKTQATREALATCSVPVVAAAKVSDSNGQGVNDALERPAAGLSTASDPQTPPAVDARQTNSSEFATSSAAEKMPAEKDRSAAVSPPARPYVYPIDANSSQAALTPEAFRAVGVNQKPAPAATGSSAFSIFADPTTLQEKVTCILDRFQALPVVQHLIKLNVPELVAQRACLEVAHSHCQMDAGAALQYIRAHNNPAELNR